MHTIRKFMDTIRRGLMKCIKNMKFCLYLIHPIPTFRHATLVLLWSSLALRGVVAVLCTYFALGRVWQSLLDFGWDVRKFNGVIVVVVVCALIHIVVLSILVVLMASGPKRLKVEGVTLMTLSWRTYDRCPRLVGEEAFLLGWFRGRAGSLNRDGKEGVGTGWNSGLLSVT